MAEYLLYCFEGHKVTSVDTFFAPDDTTAIEGAKTRCGLKRAELWEGTRKVEVLNDLSGAAR